MCKHSICPAGREGFISYRSAAISNGHSPYIEFASANISNEGGELLTQNKNQLREESIEFALAVSDICDSIQGCSVYVNQLIRSSSSIGANIHEARYAQSRADFISKLEISLKESSETEYWLELLYRKNRLSREQYESLKNSCGGIRRKLIASITTAKANSSKNS